MRTERLQLTRQKWEWLRQMLMATLPQGIAQSRLGALEEYSEPPLSFIRQWAAVLLQAYRKQIIAAFVVAVVSWRYVNRIGCLKASGVDPAEDEIGGG